MHKRLSHSGSLFVCDMLMSRSGGLSLKGRDTVTYHTFLNCLPDISIISPRRGPISAGQKKDKPSFTQPPARSTRYQFPKSLGNVSK